MQPLALENKGFCLFGLPDSGKSTLANFILTRFGKAAFVYDTLNEFSSGPYDSYSPVNRNSVTEMENIIRRAFNSLKYRLIVIDEANRYCPPKPSPLPQAIADLNDWRAHFNVSTGYIARRPVQLNQDLTELAHYIICFHLDGKNDTQYLNDLKAGFGDIVTTLKPYHFALYNKGQSEINVYKPVSAQYRTSKKFTKRQGGLTN